MSFALSALALCGVSIASACVEPNNPCDPDADPDVQAQGTRIAGVVVDQRGNALGNIAVGIVGRSEIQISAADGTFAIEDVPPSLKGYELIANAPAPLVGGRARTGALACRAALDDVELVVVVPPTSPEVELVRASGDRRLFAAFGAAEGSPSLDDIVTPPAGGGEGGGGVGGGDGGGDSGGDGAPPAPDQFFEDDSSHRGAVDVVADCALRGDTAPVAYRAQIREPFEEWKDAVLAPFLWSDVPPAPDAPPPPPGADVVNPEDLYVDRVEDLCAAAACAQLTYLESSLANPNARCVEVVGYRETVDVDGDGISESVVQPLTAYGSYQVRIRAEVRVDDAVRTAFALPERVLADAPSAVGQMSLVPGALLPVAGADGNARSVGAIDAIVTTAGGRFAIVEDDALSVLGDGKDTLDAAAQEVAGAAGEVPQNAVGEDQSATDAVAADFTQGAAEGVEAKPVAILPAGDWVRVIRRLDDGSASVEKVYVGESAEAARAGPDTLEQALMAEQPALQLDPITEAAGSELRAFSYMVAEDDVLGVDVNPRDAYVMLYGSAFVLSEQGRPDALALSYFASETARDVDGNIVGSEWASSSDGAANAGFAGACAQIASGGDSPNVVEPVAGGKVNVSVCYDVAAGLDDDVDLRDVERFEDAHVMSDAANDRVLVASQSALLCEGCQEGSSTLPLSLAIEEVRVGREPLGLVRARVLEGCPNPTVRDVVLVANHGSGDLSVLERDNGTLRETSVVPLAALPVGFLDDPIGPTCADPFVWVLADDGRTVPVDMRGAPSVPLCNGAPCEVGTRGRGFVGAVARVPGAVGPSRALVGGNGLLGELGFFRPKALRGAAFKDPDEVVTDEAVAPTP